MRTSTSRSRSSTRRSPTRALASLLCALAAVGCPRPHALAPGAEPELRVGLLVGAPSVTLGGDGELFVTDDGTGQPLGAIPAGARWVVVPDTAGRRVRQTAGERSEGRPGDSAPEITAGPAASRTLQHEPRPRNRGPRSLPRTPRDH